MNWDLGCFEYFTKESILNVRLVGLSRQKIVDRVVNVVLEGEYLVEDEITESEVEEGGGGLATFISSTCKSRSNYIFHITDTIQAGPAVPR